MFKYLEIADWLRQQIAQGIFPPGSKLPTEMQLMDQFSVSRQSVRRALQELEADKLILSVQGSGIYVNDLRGRRDREINPAYDTQPISRSRQIALVLTDFEEYIFPARINGIYETLEAAGYVVTLYFTDNQFLKEVRILQSLLDKDLAGVLMDGTQSAYPRYNDALFRRIIKQFPCVMIDSRYRGYGLPVVALDDEKGGYIATKHLIEHGHKRIAYIGRGDYRQGIKRGFGYARAMSEAGLDYSDRDMIWYTVSLYPTLFREPGCEAIIDIISAYSAVFCYNDQVACDMIHMLERHGYRVPEDISVVGYDHADLPGCEHKITSIEHPKDALGKKAAENLIRLIHDPTFDANYIFQPHLVSGDTVLSYI